MLANIISIQQNYPLGAGEPQSYLVLQLEDGQIIRSECSDEVAALVLEMHHNGQATEEEPAEAPPAVGLVEEEGQETPPVESLFTPPVEEDLIDWERLPPNVLSPTMKNIFREIGVPPKIPPTELDQIMDQVVAGANAAAREQEEEVEPAAPKPTVHVQQDASIVRSVPARRTVPKDDAGYPMVPQRNTGYDPDPGEVQDVDEDGVGQL